MTYRIRPIINLNGETRQNHIDRRIDARTALREAMARLSELRPHGRDYPNAKDRLAMDLSEYTRRFAELDALANILLDEALGLQREVED